MWKILILLGYPNEMRRYDDDDDDDGDDELFLRNGWPRNGV